MTPVERQPRITVTIDDQAYLGRDGQTVLEIARENGIRIPTLCYTQQLKPLGACRMCVVDVEGTPTAGHRLHREGGRRHGRPDAHRATLERLRRETLKMILLRHPLNCSACEINGSCELQDLVHQYDISHQDLHTYNVPPVEFAPAPWATPLIQYHPSRCILCGRCVEACLELGEVGAINFKGRGASATIAPVQPTEAFKPECISCGECMAICPANALTESDGQAQGQAMGDAPGQDRLHLLRLRLRAGAERRQERGRRRNAITRRRQQGRALRQGPLRLPLHQPQGPPQVADDQARRLLAGGELG